jgi:hypothetical protein
LNDQVDHNDIRLQRVQNIGRQIEDRRNNDGRYQEDGAYGGPEEHDNTRKMQYGNMNDEDYGNRLDFERNSLNSFDDEANNNDFSGERDPRSSRNPDYRNKYMTD